MEGVPLPTQVLKILSYFLLLTLEFCFLYWVFCHSECIFLLGIRQASCLSFSLERASLTAPSSLLYGASHPTLTAWLWVSSSVPCYIVLVLCQTVLLFCFFSCLCGFVVCCSLFFFKVDLVLYVHIKFRVSLSSSWKVHKEFSLKFYCIYRLIHKQLIPV